MGRLYIAHLRNPTITGPHVLHPQYFEISRTTGVDYQRALQVQLVPGILLQQSLLPWILYRLIVQIMIS